MINIKELQNSLEYLQFHGVSEIDIHSLKETVLIYGVGKDEFRITLYKTGTELESFIERTTKEKL